MTTLLKAWTAFASKELTTAQALYTKTNLPPELIAKILSYQSNWGTEMTWYDIITIHIEPIQ